LIKTAFITGDAAARLNTPQTAGAAALAISLDGIKTTGTDETTSETVKSILSDLKNDADRNILKTITEKDFGTLSDQDYENILRITGMDKMNYSIELHKALHKELIN
jgi:ABC-type transporter MlaC component